MWVMPPQRGGVRHLLKKLKLKHRAGGQIVQPVAQDFLQDGVLLRAGAVAGVKVGVIRGHGLAPLNQPGIIGGELLEMEAAHEHIGPEPVQQIQHPLVGAAAEQDAFSVLLDQQRLLVAELLRQEESKGSMGSSRGRSLQVCRVSPGAISRVSPVKTSRPESRSRSSRPMQRPVPL